MITIDTPQRQKLIEGEVKALEYQLITYTKGEKRFDWYWQQKAKRCKQDILNLQKALLVYKLGLGKLAQLGALKEFKTIHRKTDNCPFFLQKNGLYQATDEHGTETLRFEGSIESRSGTGTIHDVIGSVITEAYKVSHDKFQNLS